MGDPPPLPLVERQLTSCRYEISRPSAKWLCHNGNVYRIVKTKDDQVVEELPEVPTEDWYAVLANIHHDHGHHGRDEVFKKVKSITPSISKGFVAAYVSCCCRQRKSSPRTTKNVREAFAGEELAKTGKPSKGKKRVIEEAGTDSLSPPANRLKAHSTEPAMVNAGDEQDTSLRNDYSPAQMGVEVSILPPITVRKHRLTVAQFPIAMADPYQDVAGPVQNYSEVIAHQAALHIPAGFDNASAFDVTGIAAPAPVFPGSESTTIDSWLTPEDIFASGAEDWQGDDGDWLKQPAPDASGLSNLGESIHTQTAVSGQASQDTIDPRIVSSQSTKRELTCLIFQLAIPAHGDNTSHPQSQNAYDPGLAMSLVSSTALIP